MNEQGCTRFDEQLEELAVGDLAEPERGLLLAHVATCGLCRERLDDLLALTDNLLAFAPQHEPPPGFESRVLERLGVAEPAARRARQRHTSPWWVAAAAVALLGAVATGIGLGRSRWDDDPTAAGAGAVAGEGPIVAADGRELGTIQLVDGPHPFALVTIDRPVDRGQRVTCQLVLADGSAVTVGWWDYTDVKAGVWAVGVAPSLLDAVGMRILDEQGSVLATATLA
ncbi:MAG: hypothetical protein Q7V88_19175 [Actinomycetota bacterium]|nr:hypothetical protein [Actinomycetota bacterium]